MWTIIYQTYGFWFFPHKGSFPVVQSHCDFNASYPDPIREGFRWNHLTFTRRHSLIHIERIEFYRHSLKSSRINKKKTTNIETVFCALVSHGQACFWNLTHPSYLVDCTSLLFCTCRIEKFDRPQRHSEWMGQKLLWKTASRQGVVLGSS